MKYFIKSWKNDLPWLVYCLRSIAKFDPEHDVTLVLDHDVGPEAACVLGIGNVDIVDASVRFREADAIKDGYVRQQYIKLNADRCIPKGPHIQLDSDTIMLRPPTQDDFFYESKPLSFYRPWLEAGDAKCWMQPVHAALGYVTPYEFMMRPGIALYPFELKRCRRALRTRHGNVAAWLNTVGRGFSEYNVLGTLLWQKMRGSRSWFAKTQVRFGDHLWMGTPLLEQAWSWGGLDAERKARWDAILASTTPDASDLPRPSLASSAPSV